MARPIRATSQATVRARIFGDDGDGTAADPTGSDVAMAFRPTDTAPAAGSSAWITASWVTDTTTTPTTYRAQCVVAAGDLAVGTHNLFVKVEDGAGSDILPSGVLKVVP
jgi:hypothetical protein